MKLIKDIVHEGISNFSHDEERKTVRVVLFDDNNLIALLYLKKYDFYMLPGGGIDEGETPEQAAKREAREETGCSCEITHNLGVIKESNSKHNYFAASFCFVADVKREKGEPSYTDEECSEETHVQWHSLHKALSLIENQVIDSAFFKDERATAISRLVRERDVVLLNEVNKRERG